MLEHHEEEALAEIAAALRDEDPELHAAFEDHLPPPSLGPGWRSLVALALVVGLTSVVTLVFGPDAGGLVAVLGLCWAGMYAWQAMRVCNGPSSCGR